MALAPGRHRLRQPLSLEAAPGAAVLALPLPAHTAGLLADRRASGGGHAEPAASGKCVSSSRPLVCAGERRGAVPGRLAGAEHGQGGRWTRDVAGRLIRASLVAAAAAAAAGSGAREGCAPEGGALTAGCEGVRAPCLVVNLG